MDWHGPYHGNVAIFQLANQFVLSMGLITSSFIDRLYIGGTFPVFSFLVNHSRHSGCLERENIDARLLSTSVMPLYMS
jgi:hypothetical protein